jgi:AraC-like DNA-binding protein
MRTPNTDRLGTLFDRFRVQAETFFAGPLCSQPHYDRARGRGFMHLLRSGRLRVVHEQADGAPQPIELSEPTLIFYPRPWAHGFLMGERGEAELLCATLRFDGGEAHPLASALPAVLIVPLRELQPIEHTLALLFGEAENAVRGDRLLADRLFEVLLIQLLRWLLERPERYAVQPGLMLGLAHPQLALALLAMQRRPHEAWTLESLAACAGMSRSAFAASFREVVGQTPLEHLAQWRMALAKQALLRGEPVKRIAAEVGYGSASALSRAFTARSGQAPQQWLAARRADGAASVPVTE